MGIIDETQSTTKRRRSSGSKSARETVASRRRELGNPTEVAKAAGMPKRCRRTDGVVSVEALRANRSCQLSRQCLRWDRVTTLLVGSRQTSCGGARTVIVTVWVRSRAIHSRRVQERPQSLHTKAKGPGGTGRDGANAAIGDDGANAATDDNGSTGVTGDDGNTAATDDDGTTVAIVASAEASSEW